MFSINCIRMHSHPLDKQGELFLGIEQKKKILNNKFLYKESERERAVYI